MATTDKISLSLDTGALLLARRAAEIDGLSLSAWMSRLVRRHAWESERPRLTADELASADQRTVADDDQELALSDEGRRAAG